MSIPQSREADETWAEGEAARARAPRAHRTLDTLDDAIRVLRLSDRDATTLQMLRCPLLDACYDGHEISEGWERRVLNAIAAAGVQA
jgi:hypothetical protein